MFSIERKNEPIFKFHVLTAILSVLQIASEISAPLAKTDTIVLLGDDRTTSEVTRLLTNLPPAVQALTGVDLSKVRYHCEVHYLFFFVR